MSTQAFNSTYTGSQIETMLQKAEGTLTAAEITALLSTKSDASHTHDDRYYTESEVNSLLNSYIPTSCGVLYVVNKSTNDGSSISIRVPGHANVAYDRITIWCFGNMNGAPYYGCLITVSSSDGTSPGASFTGNYSPSCSYTNSGSDRVITVSDLPSWGTMTCISVWRIT